MLNFSEPARPRPARCWHLVGRFQARGCARRFQSRPELGSVEDGACGVLHMPTELLQQQQKTHPNETHTQKGVDVFIYYHYFFFLDFFFYGILFERVGGERERERENAKTLFYKDCSLG